MKKALKELITEGVIWNGKKTRAPRVVSEQLFSELTLGAVHELCLQNGFEVKAKGAWYAPLFLVSALIEQQSLEKRAGDKRSYVAWVGRRCWPTPQMLHETLGIDAQGRCIFIDPPDKQQRLWAALQLLKSPQVSCVVCDGSRFSLIATRRLQLTAHANVLGLLLRPPWEITSNSCAVTKWRVQPTAEALTPMSERPQLSSALSLQSSSLRRFSWSIELLRARGLVAPKQWQVEWQEGRGDEKGALHCYTNLVRSVESYSVESDAVEGGRRLAR